MVVALFLQYTFISASYNDDDLMPVFVTAALYALLAGYQRQQRASWLLLAGGFTGLALLTKRPAFRMLLLLGLVVPVYAWGWLRSGRRAARWAGRRCYWRDPSRLGQVEWWPAVMFFSLSFWGWFGWAKVPLDNGLMELLRRVTLALVVGCVLEWMRQFRSLKAAPAAAFRLAALTALGLGLTLNVVVLVAQLLIGPPIYVLTGRYLFPFIAAFGILAVWGWQAWWPARWKAHGLLVGLGLLAVVDFVAVVLTIVPYFYS